MKILIIGSLGNMGKRYVAICKYLGHEVVGLDLDNFPEIFDYSQHIAPDFPLILKQPVDRCIIATPIDKHYGWCQWCIKNKIPFLCEKPVSKNIEEIKKLKRLCEELGVDGRMVCNWKFIIHEYSLSELNSFEIDFDYYNTGKDGFWDMIQPVYMSHKFNFKNTSPIYNCKINDYIVNQKYFDFSYLTMIDMWLQVPTFLWSLDDAIKAHEKLMEWKEKNWRE